MSKPKHSGAIDPREVLTKIAHILNREVEQIALTNAGNLDTSTAMNLCKYASAMSDLVKVGEKIDSDTRKKLGELTTEELEAQLKSFE